MHFIANVSLQVMKLSTTLK